MSVRRRGRALVASTVVVGLACTTARTLPPCIETAPEGGPTIETGGDPVVLAAGDIAELPLSGAEATARLLDLRIPMIPAEAPTRWAPALFLVFAPST